MSGNALARLSPQFDRKYTEVDRPSIPYKRSLKAFPLAVRYWVRSEGAFHEEAWMIRNMVYEKINVLIGTQWVYANN